MLRISFPDKSKQHKPRSSNDRVGEKSRMEYARKRSKNFKQNTSRTHCRFVLVFVTASSEIFYRPYGDCAKLDNVAHVHSHITTFLAVLGYMRNFCFVIGCFSSLLLYVPLEACASWLWHLLGVFTYVFLYTANTFCTILLHKPINASSRKHAYIILTPLNPTFI